MSSQTNLYNFLVQRGDYTRSYDDFQTQFADQDSISKLYNFMAQNGDYTKSFEEFDEQFFGKQKINYDDADLGDKLTDLGARTAYGFVSFAEGLSDYKDGLLYTLSTIGEDGEKTPEAKEAAMLAIKETYGGDPFEQLMKSLDEKTLEFDEKTISETFKEGDFAEGGFRAIGAGLQSMPSILAAGLGPAGIIALGASTAGTKYEEEFEQDPNQNAVNLLFSSTGSGVIEAGFELATRGLLKRAGLIGGNRLASSAQVKLAKEILRGGAKEIVKNVGAGMASEAASEAATELTSTMWDQISLGKKINWDEKIYEIADAGIVGGLVGGVISTTGEVKKKTRASQEMAYNILRHDAVKEEHNKLSEEFKELMNDIDLAQEEDGVKEVLQDEADAILYRIRSLEERSRQGLRNLNKQELDKYFKGVQESRNLKKVIDSDKASDTAKDIAQKKYDKIREDNYNLLEQASDRKLEQNLSEAEKKARQRGGEIRTYETQDEYIEAVSGVSAKKVLNKETGKMEYTKEFMEAARQHRYSDGRHVDGVSYINLETARTLGSVAVGSHEVFHSILDAYIKDENGQVKDEMIEAIDDMLAGMSSKDRKVLEDRVSQYKTKNGVAVDPKDYYDEYLTALNDAIVKKQITFSRTFEAAGGAFNSIFRREGYANIDMSTGKGLFNMVRTYTKTIESGKSIEAIDKLVKESVGKTKGARESKSLVNLDSAEFESDMSLDERIDSYTEGANTQEDLFVRKPGKVLSPFDNIYSGILEGKFDRLFGEGISREQREIQRQDLADRFAGLTKEGGYDPAKTPELSKWMFGGSGIAGNIEFTRRVAKKELAIKAEKTKKEKRIDAKKPTKEGETGFDVADTETLTPEQALIRKEEAAKTIEKKQKTFAASLGLGPELQNKIKAAVIKTFGTKLPAVTDPKFRNALSKALRNEIGKSIEEIFGVETKYDNFIDTYFKDVIFPNLSNARLIQLERLLPKNEKIFVSKRRITKVKEVRELQEKGLIAKTIKPASGPNLIQKKKLDIKKVKEFFNPPAINPKTGKKSGLRGTRKRALAEALAEELAENQTDAVLQSPDVMNKVRELNALFEYDAVNNYAAEVARQMDRGARNSESLNRAAKLDNLNTADLRLTLNMDAIEMEDKHPNTYNALKNEAEEKRGGEQDFIDNTGFLERLKEGITNAKVLQFINNKDYMLRRTKNKVKIYNEDGAKDHVNNYSIPLLSFIPSWMGKRDLRMQKTERSKQMFLHRSAKMDSARGDFGGDLNLRQKNISRWQKALKDKMGTSKYMSKATKELWQQFQNVEGDLVLMESTMTEPESVLRRIKEVQAMNITAKEKIAILKKEFNPKALVASQLLFKAYNSSIQDWINAQVETNKMTREEAIGYIIRDKQKNTNFNKGERALAALTSIYLTDKAQKVTKYKGEHVVDSASVSAATVISLYNGTFLQDADTILKGFEQSYLPKELADQLDDLGGRNSQLGNYRFLFNPDIGKSVYDLATGKTMYQLAVEQYGKSLAKSMEKINDTSRASESLDKFYKAESFKLDPNTKPKGISIFDFDETAGISDNVIIATKNGITETIESADWPLVGDAMIKDGWEMDFSDFNKVTNGRPGPLMQKLKNQIKKYGNKDVFILTARPSQSQKAIHEYLKSEGVDLPIENITGLGNSTGEAKANWMIDKLAEGYNDFYFVDDAMPNVKAVDDLLSQFDIKSKSVQAIARNSESLGRQVNEMLEVNEGIGADVVVDDAEARVRGARKGKGIGARFFNTPGSNDFMGLMYTIANAKGKLGENQIAFFEENLYKPYRRGIDRINRLKQGISNNYKALLKSIPNAADKLKEIVPGTNFTYDTAVRVYLFNQAGHEIPGLSDQNKNKLIEAVKAEQGLIDLASGVAGIVNSPNIYIEPDNNWLGDTILSDLDNITNDVGRKQHIQEFIENRKLIFGEFKNGRLSGPMMNKLEAVYGPAYVEALNDMIWRMENGNARPSGSNAQVNAWMNWISKSVGAIMFFNTRSALLQTLSTVNFINWGDNNPIKAAAAYANQKQFWKDFLTIFNSDFLKQRRGGLRLDVNEAALAKAINQGSKNKVKAAIDYLLRIGFLPTQMADSFAIAAGGAAFYRNRINTYLKQGMSKSDAESKAFQDMIDSSEPVQQSSDPSLISAEQASILGRMVLAFQNVTMQYTRRMKKAVIDLAKGRGDFKTNISRIVYYGGVQNLVFNALQSALFALAFDDDEEEKKLAKRDRVVNGMADSILRGLGIPGAVFATGKNAIIEWAKQNKKGWSGDQTYTLIQLLNISPPIGSKARKFYSSTQTEKYNKKIIPEMSMWDISNPRYQSIGNAVEAITNIPMGRIVNKMNNIKQALDSDHQTWQRIAMMLGWNRWDVGVKDSDVLKIKEEVKKNKSSNQKSSKYKKAKFSKPKFGN